MHAKPQFGVYMMHDLGALRRARPTAIAVPLVFVLEPLNRGKGSSWGAHFGVVRKSIHTFQIAVD